MEQKGSHPRDSHSTATAGPALAPQDPNRMHSRRVAAPKTREAQIRRLLASKEGPASPGTRALADDRDAWREAKRAAANDAAEREKEELKEQMREASLEARMREEARQRDLEAKREARRAAIEAKRAQRQSERDAAAAEREEMRDSYQSGLEATHEKARSYRATLRDVPHIKRNRGADSDADAEGAPPSS